MTYNKRLPILLTILLAYALRIWQLPHTPPGLWYDEAYYAMDAAWLNDGGPWLLFFAGNNGREPIFIYLQAILIHFLGAQPLTSRLLGAYLGTLTIPLMYIFAQRLTKILATDYPSRPFAHSPIPHLATLSLTISIWHLTLSRGGFRGVLLPLVTCLVFYTFWRGWHNTAKPHRFSKPVRFPYLWFALSGITLGLSQYTYLAARALPLVFMAFAPIWTLLKPSPRPSPRGRGGFLNSLSPWERAGVRELWLGLSLMAALSAIVFAPLGWIFYQQPALFSARTGDVMFIPQTANELFSHLWAAIRLFIDSGDENWRHHLPGTPMLGWLGWLGFWPGLWLCLRRIRQTPYLFLLTALITLYIPALIAAPPIHALRLASLLPIYCIIFTLGLLHLAQWLAKILPTPYSLFLIPSLIIATEFNLISYDYFHIWARDEQTYIEYNGPLVDLVHDIIKESHTQPVLIPFHLYVHPTTRYLLHDHFTEQTVIPPNLHGPVQLITLPDKFRILNVANIPNLPSLVWLEHGTAYISRPPRQAEQAYLTGLTTKFSYHDRLGREVARGYSLLDPSPILPMFEQTQPQRTINVTWGNQAQLLGYEVTPQIIQPNHPLTLNLYWHSLTDLTFSQRLFLQLIDINGQPITQWEGDAFMEDMYRWRPNGLLPTQHTLWVGPDTRPGPYLVRLGFFDNDTKQRLPLSAIAGQPIAPPIDQIQLGLFYVSAAPQPPKTPLTATFGDAIELLGTTMPNRATVTTSWPITLHWQARQPTDRAYTVFVQLLNEQGTVITSLDKQPFNGLYPTQLWSPNENIADTFNLPIPAEGLAKGKYRLITGFYDLNTGQRLHVTTGGDTVELQSFEREGRE